MRMMPASIFAEAIRNEETIQIARERAAIPDVATREHVSRNYRPIALPALVAATLRVAELRLARRLGTTRPDVPAES